MNDCPLSELSIEKKSDLLVCLGFQRRQKKVPWKLNISGFALDEDNSMVRTKKNWNRKELERRQEIVPL